MLSPINKKEKENIRYFNTVNTMWYVSKLKMVHYKIKEQAKNGLQLQSGCHGLLWTFMDCPRLSWTVLNYYGLSWTIMDCHGWLSWMTFMDDCYGWLLLLNSSIKILGPYLPDRPHVRVKHNVVMSSSLEMIVHLGHLTNPSMTGN